MKTQKQNIIFGWIAFIFILFHFGLIMLYAMPPSVIGESPKSIARPYVSPVFEQNWSLFAPCPTINSYTEIQFEYKNGTITDWIKVGEEALEKHALTRGLHYGELVLIESNLMFSVNHDLDALGVGIGQTVEPTQLGEYDLFGYSGNRIYKYLIGYSKKMELEDVELGRFRCWRQDVITGEEGVVEFPAYRLK